MTASHLQSTNTDRHPHTHMKHPPYREETGRKRGHSMLWKPLTLSSFKINKEHTCQGHSAVWGGWEWGGSWRVCYIIESVTPKSSYDCFHFLFERRLKSLGAKTSICCNTMSLFWGANRHLVQRRSIFVHQQQPYAEEAWEGEKEDRCFTGHRAVQAFVKPLHLNLNEQQHSEYRISVSWVDHHSEEMMRNKLQAAEKCWVD